MQFDLEVQHFYHQELIDQAEESRLAREVIDARREARREQPTYNPALAWVGQRLITIGQQLTGAANDVNASSDTPNVRNN